MGEGGAGELPLGSRYRIGELLGRGGMGSVHRGRDIDGTPYAIKVLRPELAADPDVVTRFVRERTILTGVRDPHLVAVHDLVIEGNTLAIVMELVEGGDLRQALREHAVVAPAQVCRIGAGVAHALLAAHTRGVVHRDVKPENVLLDASTDPASVKLADFGIARLVGGSALSRTTALIGTPSYLAPEVCAGGPAVPAGDLYALGVLLYEMSCGVPPFVGELIAVLTSHVTLRPGRPDGIPAPLWELVERLLAKDPATRPGAAETAGLLTHQMAALATAPTPPRLARPPAGIGVDTVGLVFVPSGADTVADPATLAQVPVASAPGGVRPGLPPESRRRIRLGFSVTAAVLALVTAAGIAVYSDSGGSGAAEAALASAPTPSPTPSCDPTRLARGCQGDAVRALQARLQALCFYGNNDAARIIDGDFGAKTDAAARRFQVINGLEPDGIVGPVSRAAMASPDVRSGCAVTPSPSPSPSPSGQ